MDGGTGHAVRLGELAKTMTTLPIIKYGGVIELERLSSDVTAFEPGAAHAGAHPLDYQAALQFCDRTDDHNNGPAQWTPSIDLLPEAYELDVQPVELVEYLKEVLHGPGDPVRRPDKNNVELAAASILHHLIEPRPPGLAPGDPVSVFRNDLVTALGSHLPEIVQLRLGMLVDGGHAHI